MMKVKVMYNVGDVIFYSSTGVCSVESVGKPAIGGLPDNVDYYTLVPISKNHSERIYVPVNTTASIRPPVSERQASRYIDSLDRMKPVYPATRNPKAISDFYTGLIHTYDCRNLLQVIVSLICKRRECAAKNKHLNRTQASFLKRAQEMVYNEFSYALGISRDEVSELIEGKILDKLHS